MFQNIQDKYLIEIPSTTPQEVIEWFEIMNNCNMLSKALIDLVHRAINSIKCSDNMCINNEVPAVEAIKSSLEPDSLEPDFISSLYNWQDSSAAIFSDVLAPKKNKMKMLSI